MGNLTTALMFVLLINVFLVLGQIAITDINPNAVNFLTEEKTPLFHFAVNGTLNETNINDKLPQAETVTGAETGNVFVDTWNAVKNWFLNATGINYVLGILSAPYNFLKAIQVPDGFAIVFGSLWYMLSLYLIINFIKGGGGD